MSMTQYEAQLNIYQPNSTDLLTNPTVGDNMTVKISFKNDQERVIKIIDSNAQSIEILNFFDHIQLAERKLKLEDCKASGKEDGSPIDIIRNGLPVELFTGTINMGITEGTVVLYLVVLNSIQL